MAGGQSDASETVKAKRQHTMRWPVPEPVRIKHEVVNDFVACNLLHVLYYALHGHGYTMIGVNEIMYNTPH